MNNQFSEFKPVNMPLRGTLIMPGDKSIASRAIFLAAMAEGVSHIYDVPKSEDVMSVVRVVNQLGAKVTLQKSKFSNERNVDCEIVGWGESGPLKKKIKLYCANSATCARVSMGVVTPFDINYIIDGDDSLHHRPFMRMVDPLMQMGAKFSVVAPKDGLVQSSSLPLRVIGTSKTRPVYYEMPVASSQVKTSILFAGANTKGTTTVIEPFQSRDHGELLLKCFGADVNIDKECFLASINGPCRLKACDLHVPGDVSSAAYYLTSAALVPGSKITIKNVGINDTRLGFVRALRKMGARIDVKRHDKDFDKTLNVDYLCEPVGDICVQYSGRLSSIEVLPDEIPQMIDEIPILALAAACSEGKSSFYGVRELRLKESNRIHAISKGLKKLGTNATDCVDTLFVDGGIDIEAKRSINPTDKVVQLDHFGDHRLAIVWGLIGMCGYIPTIVRDFDVCNVSYPQFMDDFNKLIMKEP